MLAARSFPFGSDQSSYSGRWTSATSAVPLPGDRHSTPPAARIIGRQHRAWLAPTERDRQAAQVDAVGARTLGATAGSCLSAS